MLGDSDSCLLLGLEARVSCYQESAAVERMLLTDLTSLVWQTAIDWNYA